MLLSAELFEWMISTIESSPRLRLDLRRADRVALRGSVEIFLLHGFNASAQDARDVEGPLNAGVRDASSTGMRLEIPRRIHDRQRILIRLPRMDQEPMMLLAEAVHSRWNETFSSVGIRFVDAVTRPVLTTGLSLLPSLVTH